MNDSVFQSGKIMADGLSFSWAAATDIGKQRQENQDAFFVEPDIGLFLVSDGMGGHRGGALAANIVVEDLPVMIETSLAKLKSRKTKPVSALLKKNIIEQNRQLRMEAFSKTGYKDMGTTVVLMLLRSRRCYIANLGDSRIYRFRRGRLNQLSKDHSVVAELISKGQIQPEDTENHAAANQITHYIGMEEKAVPHVRSFALAQADRLLLCTDGLTGMLSDTDIAAILRTVPKADIAAKSLIDAANTAGGHDNITVILVDWLPPPAGN